MDKSKFCADLDQKRFDVRNAEMSRLHFEEAWTLQEISNKYGVSRERVRQIIGGSNGGRRAASEKIELPNDPSLSAKELFSFCENKLQRVMKSVIQNKIAHKHHTVSSGKSIEVGQAGEVDVHNKLESLGIKNELMSFGSPYDILTESKIRIDVKTCLTESRHGGASTYFHFSTRKDIKTTCDFFVLYAIKYNRFWVIPSSAIPNINAIYIKSNDGRGWRDAKYKEWNKYENRFDLLK